MIAKIKQSHKTRALTHETCGEVDVGADFAVNLDGTLHHNLGHFISGKGILESVTEHNNKRK